MRKLQHLEVRGWDGEWRGKDSVLGLSLHILRSQALSRQTLSGFGLCVSQADLLCSVAVCYTRYFCHELINILTLWV